MLGILLEAWSIKDFLERLSRTFQNGEDPQNFLAKMGNFLDLLEGVRYLSWVFFKSRYLYRLFLYKLKASLYDIGGKV